MPPSWLAWPASRSTSSIPTWRSCPRERRWPPPLVVRGVPSARSVPTAPRVRTVVDRSVVTVRRVAAVLSVAIVLSVVTVLRAAAVVSARSVVIVLRAAAVRSARPGQSGQSAQRAVPDRRPAVRRVGIGRCTTPVATSLATLTVRTGPRGERRASVRPTAPSDVHVPRPRPAPATVARTPVAGAAAEAPDPAAAGADRPSTSRAIPSIITSPARARFVPAGRPGARPSARRCWRPA